MRIYEISLLLWKQGGGGMFGSEVENIAELGEHGVGFPKGILKGSLIK